MRRSTLFIVCLLLLCTGLAFLAGMHTSTGSDGRGVEVSADDAEGASGMMDLYHKLAKLRWAFIVAAGMAVLFFLIHLELKARVRAMTAELSEKNTALEGEVKVRRGAEEELRRHEEHLEEMVEERTRDLRESEEQLRLYERVFMASSDGISVTDMDWKILKINPSMLGHTGYNAEELESMRFDELSVPEDVEKVEQDLRKTGGFQGETRIQGKDGSISYLDLSVFPIDHEDGRPGCYVSIGRDMNERRRAEEALRQREEQYRGVFDTVADGLLIFDPADGIVVEANPAACRMYGYAREEFIGRSGMDFVSPDCIQVVQDFKRDLAERGVFHAETRHMRKGGALFYAEVDGANFIYGGKPHLLAAVRDVAPG